MIEGIQEHAFIMLESLSKNFAVFKNFPSINEGAHDKSCDSGHWILIQYLDVLPDLDLIF